MREGTTVSHACKKNVKSSLFISTSINFAFVVVFFIKDGLIILDCEHIAIQTTMFKPALVKI